MPSERETLMRRHRAAEARGDEAAAAKIRERIEGPPIPYHLAHVMEWFGELSGRERDYAGMGSPVPLKSRDVREWASLRGIRMRPDEVALINDLDTVWLTVQQDDTTGSGPPIGDDGEVDKAALGKRIDRVLSMFG